MCEYCEYISCISSHHIVLSAQNKTFFEILCSISASLAPAIAILISIFLYLATNRKSIKDTILRANDQLLSLAMEYPYLEDDDICKKWTGVYSGSEELSRYNIYCCKVYNLLISLYDFYGGSYKKMSELIDIDDYIATHHVWLSLESDKTEGNKKFNTLIHERISALCPDYKKESS